MSRIGLEPSDKYTFGEIYAFLYSCLIDEDEDAFLDELGKMDKERLIEFHLRVAKCFKSLSDAVLVGQEISLDEMIRLNTALVAIVQKPIRQSRRILR